MSGPVGKNPEKRKYIDLWLLASLTFLYYFSIFYADTMNRSREQLLADILKSTHEPQPITMIMYGARLSYAQLLRHMKFLGNKGMIQKTKEGKLAYHRYWQGLP
jgi:predicted transcriptional regulator